MPFPLRGPIAFEGIVTSYWFNGIDEDHTKTLNIIDGDESNNEDITLNGPGAWYFNTGVRITAPGPLGAPLIVSNTTTNGNAIIATGNGTGVAVAGATDGAGYSFYATAITDGATMLGGQVGSNGYGVRITSAGANARGVDVVGGSNGIGVKGKITTGTGVLGESIGAGDAGKFLNASTGRALYVTRTGSPSGTGVHALYAEGYSGGINATGAAIYAEQLYTHGSGWTKCAPAIVVGQGTIHFSGSQPTSSQDPGLNNVLCGTNICKAWGHVTFNSGSVIIHDGFNIKDVTIVGLQAKVEFERDMANSNYSITFGTQDVADYASGTSTKLVGEFNLAILNTLTQTVYDLTVPGSHTVSFQVFGRQ